MVLAELIVENTKESSHPRRKHVSDSSGMMSSVYPLTYCGYNLHEEFTDLSACPYSRIGFMRTVLQRVVQREYPVTKRFGEIREKFASWFHRISVR